MKKVNGGYEAVRQDGLRFRVEKNVEAEKGNQWYLYALRNGNHDVCIYSYATKAEAMENGQTAATSWWDSLGGIH